MEISISIVVLAQRLELLKECLMNIEIYTDPPYEMIVVHDGTNAAVTEYLAGKTRLRAVDTNGWRGVAAGYNCGAAAANGERLVFMRDYVTVSELWLPRLCRPLDINAAIVGPVSSGVSGYQCVPYECMAVQEVQQTARAVAAAKAGKVKQVARLLGFLMAVRRDCFDQLDGFDERFGEETYEDNDFCYRALLKGDKLYVAEDCFVFCNWPEMDPQRYKYWMEKNGRKALDKWGFDINEALAAWGFPVSVSLCMIVKNEQQTLGRCLSSVADLVDEIVIVDTGSVDRTKEIAAEFNSRVVDFAWVDDFSKARNYAFSLATKEYILWLDADDVLLEQDRQLLRKHISALPLDVDYVSMPYQLGSDAHGNVTFSLRRNRLVRRNKNFQWIGMVHEYLAVQGRGLHIDAAVTHRRIHTQSHRNLHIFEARQQAGAVFSARDLYYYANELADHELWERAIGIYDKFLQLREGWVEDKINACGRSADAAFHLGRISEAKARAMWAFGYSQPRAEICCRLGSYYMAEKDFEQAVVWYTQATKLPRLSDPMAMQSHSYWTWLPHLQLCVCYDRLGRAAEASRHNELAAAFIPGDSRIVANRRYFAAKWIYSASPA